MNYRFKQFNILYIIGIFLLVSCGKQLTSSTQTNHSTNEVKVVEADSDIVNIIEPYKKKLDGLMNKVIGFAEIELVKGDYQSTLGNFINDIILKKSIEYHGKSIDFALVTNGGLRTPIPQGNVTRGNIFELMPFENELVILELKGITVYELAKYAAARGNAPMSGLKYEVFIKQPRNVFIQGEKLDTSKVYSMVVSDYLANGGDGLELLKEAKSYTQLDKMYRDAIIEGIEDLTENGKNINAVVDDRVKFVK